MDFDFDEPVLARDVSFKKLTLRDRLEMIAVPLISKLLANQAGVHPDLFIELVGDKSGRQLRVATGQGNHGKGADLHKNSDGEILPYYDNVVQLLKFTPAADRDEFVGKFGGKAQFEEAVKALPRVSS